MLIRFWRVFFKSRYAYVYPVANFARIVPHFHLTTINTRIISFRSIAPYFYYFLAQKQLRLVKSLVGNNYYVRVVNKGYNFGTPLWSIWNQITAKLIDGEVSLYKEQRQSTDSRAILTTLSFFLFFISLLSCFFPLPCLRILQDSYIVFFTGSYSVETKRLRFILTNS